MKLSPMNAGASEASSPRYPTRQGWRQRQGRWVRGALAAAGAAAVLASSGCRTAGEPVPPRLEETRTAGTPPAVDPVKPPEGVQQAQEVKPPEVDAGLVEPPRTAGVPPPVTLPTPAPPQPAPPVAPPPPPPTPRLSGARAPTQDPGT